MKTSQKLAPVRTCKIRTSVRSSGVPYQTRLCSKSVDSVELEALPALGSTRTLHLRTPLTNAARRI